MVVFLLLLLLEVMSMDRSEVVGATMVVYRSIGPGTLGKSQRVQKNRLQGRNILQVSKWVSEKEIVSE